MGSFIDMDKELLHNRLLTADQETVNGLLPILNKRDNKITFIFLLFLNIT